MPSTVRIAFSSDVCMRGSHGTIHTETIKKTDWEAKTIPKAFWRGSLTGAFHNDRTNWRKSQRERMCYKVKETGTQKTVLVDLGNGTTRAIPFDVETLNAHYLDVAPVGGAVQVSFGATWPLQDG